MELEAIVLKSISVAFFALMPVINPVGTSVILLGLTQGADDKTRLTLARKIALNTIILLGVMLFAGSYLLQSFGISVPIVQVAGGFVLASMGWQFLNQKSSPPAAEKTNASAVDPAQFFSQSFYPFTFPITVGPGGVAVILTLSAHNASGSMNEMIAGKVGAFIGVIAIGIVSYYMFGYAHRIFARLGQSSTEVMMRLISFLIVCIGVEIAWTGIHALIKSP